MVGFTDAWQQPANFRFHPERSVLSTWTAPVSGVVAYLTVLLVLKRRPGRPLSLKPVEMVHNAFLVVLSSLTAIAVAYAAYERARKEGWMALICTQRAPETAWDGRLGFWTYIFYLTKYYELIDTVLLALKKKPLLPLHVYHHAVMLFIGWSWFKYPWLEGSWFCAWINSVIHTAMYTYYFLASCGRKVWWKRYLTTAQIVQFILGSVYVMSFYLLSYTRGCSGNLFCATLSLAVNFSFLALFVSFYKGTYKFSSAHQKKSK
mmetsp:Transcript_6403/g.19372  ORF Transcript_6403/g.19372 Transcript_6403/m.19372 type:complete len:262 (-) Transcript_6403:35-820(-)